MRITMCAAVAALLTAGLLALPDRASAQERPIARGDTGHSVEVWQSRLNLWFRLLRDVDGPMVVDGIFGPSTENATREFQRVRIALAETGRADLQTWAELGRALATLVKTPPSARGVEWPLPIPRWFWSWAQWYLGRGDFEGQARDPSVRPAAAPRVIPQWSWRRVNVMNGRTEEARGLRLAHDRVHAVYGVDRAVAGSTVLRSERDRFWLLVTGRSSRGNWAAWLRLRAEGAPGRWVPWQLARLAPGANLNPGGAPCDIRPAFAEPEC